MRKFLENITKIDFSPFDDINYSMYSFDETVKIHETIVNIISNVRSYVTKVEYEIEDDKVRVDKLEDNLVFEKRHHTHIFLNKNKLHNEMLNKLYQYQLKTLSRIMLKLKLLYSQIASDIQFESFNYSSRESVTETIHSKLKNIVNKQNFEDLLINEIKYEQPPNKYSKILKFFSKFCIYI